MVLRLQQRSFLLYQLAIASLVLSACAPLIPIQVSTTQLPAPSVQTVVSPTATPNLAILSDEQIRGTQITLWHGLEGEYAKSLEALVAEWNITNPYEIKIEVVGYGNLRNLEAALDIDPGQAYPQLGLMLPSQAQVFSGKSIDLSPFMRDGNIGMSSDLFVPAMLPLNLNGDQILSIPFAKSVRVVVENRDFAADLGIKSSAQSLDEFIKQACIGNQYWRLDEDPTNDGLGGWALDTDVNWQTPLSLLVAGQPQNTTLMSNLSQPEVSAIFGKLFKMRETGCSWLPEQGTGQQQFAERKAIFVSLDLQQVAELRSEMATRKNPDQLNAIAYPGATPMLIPYGPDLVVFRSTPQQQFASWLFIRWLLQDSQQQTWAQQTGLLPVTRHVLENSHPVGQDLLVKQIWGLILIQNTSPIQMIANGEKANWIIGDGYYSFNRYFPYYEANNLIDDLNTHLEELTK